MTLLINLLVMLMLKKKKLLKELKLRCSTNLNDNEDIRSLKSLILFGLRGISAYAYHAFVLGIQMKK